MVRVTVNRGTSTRKVGSSKSEELLADHLQDHMEKSEEQNQVRDLVEELLAEVAEKNPNLVQQV